MPYATKIAAAAALALLCLHGSAEAKGMTIAQLKSLVKDLGYDGQSDDKAYVLISEQGKWRATISLNLVQGGDALELASNLGAIPEDGQKVVPFGDMLKANDDNPYFLAIGQSDGKATLFQEAFFDTATVNKQMLRKTIDAFLLNVDTMEPIWGQDHWAAAAAPVAAAAPATPPAAAGAAPAATPAAPAATASTKAFCDPSVEKAPLTVQNVTFRNGEQGQEGGTMVRPTSTFGAEEKMFIFLQVTGFQCNVQANGQYQALLTVGQFIKADADPEGRYESFGSFSKSLDFDLSSKVDTAFLDVTLTPHWKTTGKFTFKYDVHDNISGKDASIAIPFVITPKT